MQHHYTEPMNASLQFCPNAACSARGQIGQGNITIHGHKRPRYRYHTCGQTFSARRGTMWEGLRKPTELIVIVVTLLAYGCPLQAIVHAYGLDERTVASWRDRAGTHCQQVHQALIEQGKLDLLHVQADEIRVKGCSMIAWMGLTLMVSTRLWLGGTVSLTRDKRLADRLMFQVCACAQALCAVLVCTDGWAAYPNSIRRAFREKVTGPPRRGRPRCQIWPHVQIGTVIKHSVKKHVTAVSRRMSYGAWEQAQVLLKRSGGGSVLNTAFIERFNGTMRERLAALTRKCHHPARRLQALHTGMYLIGCTYNFCWPHHTLSRPSGQGCPQRAKSACTPAMASGVTDHVWSMFELLSYRIAPPRWSAPRRRGRPRLRPLPDPTQPKRPRGRPRTRPLPDPAAPKRPRGRPRKVVLCPFTT
jgi:transposase-like protein/IS1 family transposase